MRTRLPFSSIGFGKLAQHSQQTDSKPEPIAALYTHSLLAVLQHVWIFKGYLSYSPSSWLACSWVKCALISKYFQLRQQTHSPSHPPQFNCKLTMSRPGQFIIAGSIIRNLEACSRFGRVWRTKMCRYDVIQENNDVLCLFSPNSWDKKRNQRCFDDLNCKFFLVNIHYFSSPAHAAKGVTRS